MTFWHVEAFEFETKDSAEWETDTDGDQSIYRSNGAGWIFIPEGVGITEIKPLFKAGRYRTTEDDKSPIIWFDSAQHLSDYAEDYGYSVSSFVKVGVFDE